MTKRGRNLRLVVDNQVPDRVARLSRAYLEAAAKGDRAERLRIAREMAEVRAARTAVRPHEQD